MKAGILFLLFVSLSWVSYAKKDDAIHIKSLDITLQKVPGGTYMSQEVTNGMYLAFLHDLIKQGRTTDALKFTPDTLAWRSEIAYCNPMVEYYFRHPAYKGYPVIGIELEDANAYCAWLTEKIRIEPKLNLPNAVCALPTEAEWITASAPFYDNPYPWYGPYAYNEQGEMLCNVKVDRVDKNVFHQYQGIGTVSLTAATESYRPNQYGLHNMIGNVAELTSEGYVKGGSWGHTIDECAVNKRQDLELPSAFVGFRIVLKPNGFTATSNK